MALNVKLLGGAASIPTSTTALYTPSSNKGAVVKSVVLCSKTSGTVTAKIAVLKAGTTEIMVFNGSLSGNATYVLPAELTLSNDGTNADVLRVSAGTNAVVDASAYGIERDQ